MEEIKKLLEEVKDVKTSQDRQMLAQKILSALTALISIISEAEKQYLVQVHEAQLVESSYAGAERLVKRKSDKYKNLKEAKALYELGLTSLKVLNFYVGPGNAGSGYKKI